MIVPCTRGLQHFKDGCPERPYNYADGTGCPLWIEKEVPTRANPQVPEMQRMCVDKWTWLFQWSTLGALEGNQAATESFRNCMCEPDPLNPNSAGQPKPVRISIDADVVRDIMMGTSKKLLPGE